MPIQRLMSNANFKPGLKLAASISGISPPAIAWIFHFNSLKSQDLIGSRKKRGTLRLKGGIRSPTSGIRRPCTLSNMETTYSIVSFQSLPCLCCPSHLGVLRFEEWVAEKKRRERSGGGGRSELLMEMAKYENWCERCRNFSARWDMMHPLL